ncbi:flavin reductase family protein [Clostridium ganghwense]|uniref:Flavin reductase family protein n=1 Tax=Clostridium ganghwense TaxID=312089 RepID=A0ABT4CJ69_9CLOT|nr:flavin reductase family protein [Clostridium ganghwense]MCY6369096.1 flavin reductase family protein [Clostridium ganghwense]
MAVNFTENLEKGMEYLHKRGAFLTTKVDDKVNTMTISWGSIGFEWNKPIFTVFVRKSRYTHQFVEKSGKFTVSIPVDDSMKEDLAFCGKKSGRDVNKFEECNLKIEEGKEINVPVVGECGLVYECRVVYKQDMDLNLIDEEIRKVKYSDEDIHTVYYGEIVACYLNK